MKHSIWGCAAFSFVLLVGDAQPPLPPPPPAGAPPYRGVLPKGGFVPDAETARKIGEAVLAAFYGERVISEERPFNAALRGSEWVVQGTVKCDTAPPPPCPGGAAFVKISKKSGQITFMAHYQ